MAIVCQLAFMAFLAFVGRDLVPAAVYAFDDAVVGWVCIFAFLALLVLTFHINDGKPASSEPADGYLDSYNREIRRLRSEIESLKISNLALRAELKKAKPDE